LSYRTSYVKKQHINQPSIITFLERSVKMADSAKSGMQDKMVAIGWIGLAASFHFAAYEFARGSTIVLYTTQFGSAAMSYALTGNSSLAVAHATHSFFLLSPLSPL
jgi:hypothetical protein